MPERLPLTPHGAARAFFTGNQPVDELDQLFSALRGALAQELPEEELFIAEELARQSSWLSARKSRALCLAVVAALMAARQGSTRLPLGGGPNGALGSLLAEIRDLAGLELAIGPLLEDIRALVHENYFGRLVGSPGEVRPLIAANEALYLHRLFVCEQELIERLKTRLRDSAPSPQLAEACARAAAKGPFALSEEQRRAVEVALSTPLAVISGGPGTGKTAIAAAILRAATSLGRSAGRIALAAPTGKAAQRLSSSIASGLGDDELARAIAPATTLHRLLGYRPGHGFRHGEGHPLAADLVVVDEASMVDVALMNQLMSALTRDTQLVLLGDANQLPSVEAGAVLRDLVVAGDRPGARPAYSARLSYSYRMGQGDAAGRAILEASQSVADGVDAALAELPRDEPDALTFAGITRVNESPDAVARFVAHWCARHIESPSFLRGARRSYSVDGGRLERADESAVRELIRTVEACKILTATRRDASGSEAIAELAHARLRRALERSPSELGAGEPVLVTRNDYRHGLFNGDSGLLIRVHSTQAGSHLRIAFTRDDRVQLLPLQALRGAIELGLAVTVHRAQGSEYDHVAVVVPPKPLPLLTRELVYTALTRARRSVSLLGPLAVYRAAVRRPTQRFSGVVEALCANE